MGAMEGWKPPFLPAPQGGGFRAAATVKGSVKDYTLLGRREYFAVQDERNRPHRVATQWGQRG
ncbi:MAG: hypothetical protein C4337_10100 [Armatimonadota bacterium]